MTSGIYAITNTINNKVYIGQTNDLNRRKREHLSYLRTNKHSNEHLQTSWNKYGEQNFTFNILKECPIDDLNKWEKWFIFSNKSDDNNYGYNKDKGGTANKIVSDETKRKMSENHYNCCGENNPIYGKPRPQEVRDKISKTRIKKCLSKGENNPFYGRRGGEHPQAKYFLWNSEKVGYNKHFSNDMDFRKCFRLKYNGKQVYVGGFIDFITPQIIYDFIKGCDKLAV